MNPKEMTNEQLYVAVQDGVINAVNPFGNGEDILTCPRTELLRRLNEADALRKERNALRMSLDEHIEVLSEVKVERAALRKENEELRSEIRAIEEPLMLGFDLFFSSGSASRCGFPMGYCITQYDTTTSIHDTTLARPSQRVVGYGETLSECTRDWMAWRDSSNNSKESEASHE